jgi:hypothetical protein
MRVPPSDPLANWDHILGNWYELRRKGQVLYRRVIAGPLDSFEAPNAPAEQSMFRKQAPGLNVELVLLVPDLADADTLAVIIRRAADSTIEWTYDFPVLRDMKGS